MEFLVFHGFPCPGGHACNTPRGKSHIILPHGMSERLKITTGTMCRRLSIPYMHDWHCRIGQGFVCPLPLRVVVHVQIAHGNGSGPQWSHYYPAALLIHTTRTCTTARLAVSQSSQWMEPWPALYVRTVLPHGGHPAVCAARAQLMHWLDSIATTISLPRHGSWIVPCSTVIRPVLVE